VIIKHLEYLSALAREKHFSRAAAACNVTQPTLSAGIKQLEEAVGALVVERGHQYRGLTPEGERVLAWAHRILEDYDSLHQELSAMRGGMIGTIRIGVIPTALPIISLITTPFAKLYPEVTIRILSRTSAEIQRGLDEFELDVGLTYLDNEPLTRVRRLPLYRERYLLFTPRSTEMEMRSAVTWREAAAFPLCLLTQDMQNRRILDAHFREAGDLPRLHIETNSTIALYSHLRSGQWSSILPHTIMYLFTEMPGIVAIPLAEPDASHSVGLIAAEREPLTPLASAILDTASRLELSAFSDFSTSASQV
jgi:DNA-binding transcriptional LysR family regulator